MLPANSPNLDICVPSSFHSPVNMFLSLESHPFIMGGHLGCRSGSVETSS